MILEVNSRGNSRDEQSLINEYLANNTVKQKVKGARRVERHSFNGTNKTSKNINGGF